MLLKKIARYLQFTIKTFTIKKPVINEILPEEKLTRTPPKNFTHNDLRYFAHEFSKIIQPCFSIYCQKAIVTKNAHVIVNNLVLKESNSGTENNFTDLYWNFDLYNADGDFDKCCVFTQWSDNYFHWFGEAVPKLMYLKKNNILKNYTYFFPDNHKKQFIIDTLNYLGVKFEFFDSHKLLFAKKLHYISLTAQLGNFRPELQRDIRNYFTSHLYNDLKNIKPFRKVYISRIKAIRRHVTNEMELIPILLKFGYEIYTFEDLSLAEQIKLMMETKNLISIHGAGLCNMHFMQKETTLVELRLEEDTHMNLFYSLASSLELNYYYLMCKGSTTNNDIHEQNITVNVNKLEKLLTILHAD